MFPTAGTGVANLERVLRDGAVGDSAKASGAEPIGVVSIACATLFTALTQELCMTCGVRPKNPSVICFTQNGIEGEPQDRFPRNIQLLARPTRPLHGTWGLR